VSVKVKLLALYEIARGTELFALSRSRTVMSFTLVGSSAFENAAA